MADRKDSGSEAEALFTCLSVLASAATGTPAGTLNQVGQLPARTRGRCRLAETREWIAVPPRTASLPTRPASRSSGLRARVS